MKDFKSYKKRFLKENILYFFPPLPLSPSVIRHPPQKRAITKTINDVSYRD